jgi:hypothetical protein
MGIERLYSGRDIHLPCGFMAAALANGYWLGLSGTYCASHAVRGYTRDGELVLWSE